MIRARVTPLWFFTEMDGVTQQNAVLVEQASSIGESVAEQAQMMRQLLSFFTVKDNV